MATTTSPANMGPNVLIKSISDTILEIAKTGGSVASFTNIFQANGEYKFLANMGYTPAKIVAEMANVSTTDPNFKEVKLRQKRMASAIEITQNALGMAIQPTFNNHVKNLLTYNVLLGIEEDMFNTGDANGTIGLQNILLHNAGTNKLEDINVVTGSSTAIAYDDLWKAYIQLTKQPKSLEGAMLVVEDVSKISSIVDGSGASILKYDNVPTGAIGRVFGLPVYKVNAFTSGQKVGAVFINPFQAYAVSIAKDAEVKQIKGDTIQEYKKSSISLGEIYIDGKVVNPRAIVIVKTT
ncbi:phage major capsid protein [Priestia sp. 40]|uniref:phage major capsid protein n=1 Tax=Priestia sp. 40 TaxID=3394459 RepID=UPI003BF6778F